MGNTFFNGLKWVMISPVHPQLNLDVSPIFISAIPLLDEFWKYLRQKR